MSTQPAVVAVVSDVHANSALAMVPPEGVTLDDGGTYTPSKINNWLWSRWNGDFWPAVAQIRKKHKAKLYCVYNGDLVEGLTHHGTTQVVSAHPEPQAYLLDRIFGVPRALKPDHTFIVRGTEAHVGPSGASEEAFARSIGAEKDHESGRWSWWHLRLSVNGLRFDFQHHPSTRGSVPWTAPQACARMAFRVWTEHTLRKLPHPHLVFRSHTHVHQDSYDQYPTRAIVTPSWQIKTAHAHKVASDSIADVGGVIVFVHPDGRHEISKKLYEPELPKLWVA